MTRLLCLLGFHEWVYKRHLSGSWVDWSFHARYLRVHVECENCHKERDFDF